MEDITLVNDNELNIALEAIEVHLANLDRVRYLYNEAMENGVNRVTMESLYSIYPESIKDTTHPYLFTIQLSDINKEYAMEGFVDAIAEGIKWIFTQIIEIFKAIVKYLVQFCDWLSGEIKRRDKKKGYSYESEELKKKSDEVLTRFNKAINEVKAKNLESNSELSNIIKNFTDGMDKLNNEYNTKLDIAICNMEAGYSQSDILNNAKVILKIVEIQSGEFSIMFHELRDMILKGENGTNLHNELTRLNKKLLDNEYLLIVKSVYSFKYLLECLSKFNGIPCNVLIDLASKHNAEVKYGINETRFERHKNEIWGYRVVDGHNSEVQPIEWNVNSNRLYTLPLLTIANSNELEIAYGKQSYNCAFFNKFKTDELDVKQKILYDLENKVDVIKAESEKIFDDIKEIFDKDSKSTVEKWKVASKGSNQFDMVWPKYHHYKTSEDSVNDRIDQEGFTAEEVINKLSNNLGFWTTIFKPIAIYSNGFKELPFIFKRIEELDKIKIELLQNAEKYYKRAEEKLQEEKDKQNK